ncbi:GNAT family protein [Paenibacillus sp. HB172176]|uniref:GNAT family N-acetyltransferase n=1 Tax=Paenibacillus sp. HB172176 TaxID=2493690 RepID=UPI00143883B0|nr:GNAT family protein [Paenibacillus sp. HB172176]
MKLETGRLIIRDFRQEDWLDVHAYASSPLVATHMIWGPNTEADTMAFIDSVIRMQEQTPRVDYEFALIRKETGNLIGGVGIHVVSDRVGEIGYCLHPDYWRQGFGSEAAREMLRFGFGTLGLHRIYATCRPDNIGSASVMKKIGMRYEGHLREHMFHKGKWPDSYLHAILALEFAD